LNYRLK